MSQYVRKTEKNLTVQSIEIIVAFLLTVIFNPLGLCLYLVGLTYGIHTGDQTHNHSLIFGVILGLIVTAMANHLGIINGFGFAI